MSPRRYREQPARCICQPGGDAAREHAKPGKTTADHLNPRCPHSELRLTTAPAPKTKGTTRLRLED